MRGRRDQSLRLEVRVVSAEGPVPGRGKFSVSQHFLARQRQVHQICLWQTIMTAVATKHTCGSALTEGIISSCAVRWNQNKRARSDEDSRGCGGGGGGEER